MPPAKLEAVAPAGAINSNARDMAQWLRFMLARGVWNGKRLVSEAGYNELITEQIKISSSVGYGLGWYLVDWKGHKVVVHAGNTAGYSAEVALMPDHGVGVVTLTNQDDSSITKAVRDSVWSNLVADPPGVASTAQNQGSRNVVKSELDGSADAGVLLPSQKGLLGSYQSAFAGPWLADDKYAQIDARGNQDIFPDFADQLGFADEFVNLHRAPFNSRLSRTGAYASSSQELDPMRGQIGGVFKLAYSGEAIKTGRLQKERDFDLQKERTSDEETGTDSLYREFRPQSDGRRYFAARLRRRF